MQKLFVASFLHLFQFFFHIQVKKLWTHFTHHPRSFQAVYLRRSSDDLPLRRQTHSPVMMTVFPAIAAFPLHLDLLKRVCVRMKYPPTTSPASSSSWNMLYSRTVIHLRVTARRSGRALPFIHLADSPVGPVPPARGRWVTVRTESDRFCSHSSMCTNIQQKLLLLFDFLPTEREALDFLWKLSK